LEDYFNKDVSKSNLFTIIFNLYEKN